MKLSMKRHKSLPDDQKSDPPRISDSAISVASVTSILLIRLRLLNPFCLILYLPHLLGDSFCFLGDSIITSIDRPFSEFFNFFVTSQKVEVYVTLNLFQGLATY